MKKRNLILASSMLSILIVSGCSTPKDGQETTQLEKNTGNVSDSKSKAILNYINKDLKKLAKQEKEVMDLYSGVTAENYTDDETVANTLTDKIIPKYNVFISDLESVKVRDKGLSKIHEKYVKAVNMQNSAFIEFLSAIEKQDLDKINHANSELAKARALMREYQNELQDYAKENNVSISL